MKLLMATLFLLVMSCASQSQTATTVSSPSTMQYMTQETCHPDVPLIDSRDPRVVPPKPVTKVDPTFPEELRASREPIDSLVIVEAVIDEKGNVTDVCPFKGDPRLLKAMMNSMRQWKFTPGTIDGRPSAFRFNSTANFRLR